jgi:hypothetical protein
MLCILIVRQLERGNRHAAIRTATHGKRHAVVHASRHADKTCSCTCGWKAARPDSDHVDKQSTENALMQSTVHAAGGDGPVIVNAAGTNVEQADVPVLGTTRHLCRARSMCTRVTKC